MLKLSTSKVIVLCGITCITTCYVFPLLNVYPIIVHGESMEPTLEDKSILLMERSESFDYLDICLVSFGDNLYLKRLIGMPNDNVDIVNENIYVNDVLLFKYDTYIEQDMSFSLSDNEYFFIGDNPEISFDSRYWIRFINKDDILYKNINWG